MKKLMILSTGKMLLKKLSKITVLNPRNETYIGIAEIFYLFS